MPRTCPPDHDHQTSTTCYIQHRCRCGPCRSAATAHARHRERMKLYGRWDSGLVPAEPVRAHLQYLSENGVGYKRIAELAGVSRTGVRTILYGRQDPGPRYGELPKQCSREKAERILRVELDFTTLAPGARVSARGTHRRIQALAAVGWSQWKLERLLGLQKGHISALLRRQQVTVARHLQIADLYEQLWNQQPDHTTGPQLIAFNRAQNTAHRHGWLPPLAWDDIDNDPEPPTVETTDAVDDTAVELAVTGVVVDLTPRDREAAVVRLHRQGRTDGDIAAILHCSSRTVLRIRGRLGIPANTIEGAA